MLGQTLSHYRIVSKLGAGGSSFWALDPRASYPDQRGSELVLRAEGQSSTRSALIIGRQSPAPAIRCLTH